MFIILHNPLSKNRKAKRTTKKVVDRFKRNGVPFRLKSLLKIRDIEQYIKDTPKEIKILLLGGDGTINHFINNTYDLPIKNEIYLQGNGSGNDFMRSLKKLHPEKQHIMKLKHNEDIHYYMNGCGMGLDGKISHLVNQSKRKSKFNYFFNTLRSFFTYKPRYAEVSIDGKLHTFKKAYLVNANSGQYIGGGIRLTPKARLDDDMLDVVVVHRIPRLFLFFIFLTVYFGKHTWFKRYVFYKKAKRVKATMFSSQIAQCDGESFPNTKEYEVSASGKYAHFKVFDFNKHT